MGRAKGARALHQRPDPAAAAGRSLFGPTGTDLTSHVKGDARGITQAATVSDLRSRTSLEQRIRSPHQV